MAFRKNNLRSIFQYNSLNDDGRIFEFVIHSFLNFYSINLTFNGEVLGVMISSFCIILACIFLPISLLWAIFSKNEKELASKEFEDRWGALFEFLKTKSKLTRFYNLIFVLRRFLFVMLCFYKNESWHDRD